MPTVTLGQIDPGVCVGVGGCWGGVGDDEMVGMGVGGTVGTGVGLGAQADSASNATVTERKKAIFIFHSSLRYIEQQYSSVNTFLIQFDAVREPAQLDIKGYFLVRLRNKNTPPAIKPITAPRIKPTGPPAS